MSNPNYPHKCANCGKPLSGTTDTHNTEYGLLCITCVALHIHNKQEIAKLKGGSKK